MPLLVTSNEGGFWFHRRRFACFPPISKFSIYDITPSHPPADVTSSISSHFNHTASSTNVHRIPFPFHFPFRSKPLQSVVMTSSSPSTSRKTRRGLLAKTAVLVAATAIGNGDVARASSSSAAAGKNVRDLDDREVRRFSCSLALPSCLRGIYAQSRVCTLPFRIRVSCFVFRVSWLNDASSFSFLFPSLDVRNETSAASPPSSNESTAKAPGPRTRATSSNLCKLATTSVIENCCRSVRPLPRARRCAFASRGGWRNGTTAASRTAIGFPAVTKRSMRGPVFPGGRFE